MGLIFLLRFLITLAPIVGDVEAASLEKEARPGADESLESTTALGTLRQRLSSDRLRRLVAPLALLTLIFVGRHCPLTR